MPGKPSPSTRAKMKAAWTPRRRRQQARRARVRRVGPNGKPSRGYLTMQNWRRIRARRRRGLPWKEERLHATEVPVLTEGIVVNVLIRCYRSGWACYRSFWRRVKVKDGERVFGWTWEMRRAQAERLALPGRRKMGQPKEVLDRARRENLRRMALRKRWGPDERARQREVAAQQGFRGRPTP